MKLISHLIALNIPNADPMQISAALLIGLAYFKRIVH